jgi:hypothetical protein
MRNLQRRLRQLEARRAQRKPVRLLVRYEGSDWEKHEESDSDLDEADEDAVVVVVQYVDMPAKAPLGPTG